jgi:hypothetical protein
MVRPERIELPTSWFVAKHSIQLSYGRIVADLRLWIIAETEAFRRTCPPKTSSQTLGAGAILRFPIHAKPRTGCGNR